LAQLTVRPVVLPRLTTIRQGLPFWSNAGG
jgi:hypothetical protein